MANPKAPIKPPKEEWPTFILDLGAKTGDKWTIRKFEDCEKDFWNDKLGWTYSTISYAWGYWHDKRATTAWHDSAKEPAYPAFDPKITITWKFPVVNKNYKAPFSYQDPIDPIFTIQDMQKTLTALKTRFVWFDWACIPQGPEDDLKAAKLLNPGPPPNPQTLLDLQTLEVNKMRIVYPHSLNGCLWLHQTTWARDTKSVKGPIQLLLEYIINMNIAKYSMLTIDAVEAFYGLLVACQNTQASLTSMWSFQEGVLFGDHNRPQVLNSSTCLILDHNGDAFGTHVDNLPSGQGDYVQDIVATASTIFGVITGVLASKAISQPLGDRASSLEKWCYSEEDKSRDLLSRLVATGFVGYINDNPMSLLESKFTRSLRSTWSSEADRTVRAVIGAMNVDIEKDVLLRAEESKLKAKQDFKTNNPNAGWRAVDAAGDKAECAVLKPAFLATLVKNYQWRLLLHARGKETQAPAAGTSKSWWTTFLDIKRPAFASLEYYIGSTKLYDLYKPRQPRPILPADVYDLPALEVAQKDEQPLVVKSKPVYKFYDISSSSSKGWTECEFYDYIKATPQDLPQNLEDMPGFPHQPGTVKLNLVDFKDVATREKILGTKLILLPFEKASVLPVKIRCFVLADYDLTKRTATFRGVGDFQKLDDVDLKPMDKDLELW